MEMSYTSPLVAGLTYRPGIEDCAGPFAPAGIDESRVRTTDDPAPRSNVSESEMIAALYLPHAAPARLSVYNANSPRAFVRPVASLPAEPDAGSKTTLASGTGSLLRVTTPAAGTRRM